MATALRVLRQPKRHSRTTWEKMAGTSFYMFWFRFIPVMFSALSAAFMWSRVFCLFFCSFGCSLFCRLLGFRQLNYANFNGNGNECDGCGIEACVIIPCLFLCCCLQKFTKQQREIGTSVLLIWEPECELYYGQFIKFLLSNFEAILQILFGRVLTL